MITIDKPVVISEKQKIVFKELTIISHNSLSAVLTFENQTLDGTILQHYNLTYSGEDFNTFWKNFNTGTFLFQELNRVKNLGLDIENNSQEEDFTN
jgi:hypothetical protein